MYTQPTLKLNFLKKPQFKNVKEGKNILLHDILTYIQKNAQFIGNPEILKIEDVNVLPGKELNLSNIDHLIAGKKSTLSNLPKNLQHIFGEFCITRTGVLQSVNVPKNADISFFSSLFEIFFADMICNESEKRLMIEDLIRKLYMEAKANFNEMKYKEMGWMIKEFLERVKSCSMEKDIYRYCADFLHINIFILDLETDTLYYSGSESFVPYKKNAFVLRFDMDHFEPLYFDDLNTYTPSTTSHIIQKLMNNRYLVEYQNNNLNSDVQTTQFIVQTENLDRYLPKKQETVQNEKNKLKSKKLPVKISESNNSDGNEFIEEENESSEREVFDHQIDSIEVKKNTRANRRDDSDRDDSDRDNSDRDDKTEVQTEVQSDITVKLLEKKTVAEIKTIAKKAKIRMTFKNDRGGVSQKTKKQLIDEIVGAM